MSNSNKPEQDVNLAEMSDDEILNFDPSRFAEEQNEDGKKEVSAEADTSMSPTKSERQDTESEETDGAVSEDASAEDQEDGDSTSVEDDVESGTAKQSKEFMENASSDDQSDDDASAKTTKETAQASSEMDYKAEYEKLMAPFKAAKREISLDKVDDARRLMQMGVDYSRKMEQMKPYQRVLKTLERNDLLDEEKVNFLIDLDKKNPDAIKKFLKDSEIDPLDLSLEDDSVYTPNDHMMGDKELVLNEVLDEISNSPKYQQTAEVITSWDTASKQLLMDKPEVIGFINKHMEVGMYDLIANRMERERMFGNLKGLSDLAAYRQVGEVLQKEGAFDHIEAPNPNAPHSAGNTTQGSAQDSGSNSASAEELRNRKRAASPTKGSASTGKPKVDLSKLSDEEILNLDPATL